MDKFLSTEVLREAYKQALLENHNDDFINLIREELSKKEGNEVNHPSNQETADVIQLRI